MKYMIAAILTMSFVCARSANADKTHTQQMDLVLKEVTKANSPGLVVAVVQDGQTTYTKAIGLANLEYAVKISENTVFDMASLAKQFTGYAVASLVKQGRLELSDPVNKHLSVLGEPYEEITILHLAHHTSGIRDVVELFNLGDFGSPFTSTEALRLISRQSKLNFQPGSECDYSNSNYVLLALVVEKITGQTFREWCKQNIFTTLEMTSSFVNDNPRLVIRNRAVAYYGEPPEFSFEQDNGMSLIGSSAVYSSVADMQKWLKFLMTTSAKEGPTRLMLQPGRLDSGEPIMHGLGLSIHSYRGTTVVEHSGSTHSGFRSHLAFFPKEQIGFVVLCNWGDVDVLEQIGKRIIDIYLDEKLAERSSLERSSAVVLSAHQLRQFVGEFLLNGESNVKIALSENQLTLTVEGQGTMNVSPVSSHSLYVEELDSKAQFVEDAWDVAKVFQGGNQIGTLKRMAASDESSYLPKTDLAGMYWNDEMDLLFSVEICDGRMILHKSATSSVELVHRFGEQFKTRGPVLSRVEFSRDDAGRPNWLTIDSGSRCRDVRFRRFARPN